MSERLDQARMALENIFGLQPFVCVVADEDESLSADQILDGESRTSIITPQGESTYVAVGLLEQARDMYRMGGFSE